jgi:hypothetical protein
MKKITLNAEKRNSIANVIETHFRNANSKLKVNWLLAKNKFNDHKETMHEFGLQSCKTTSTTRGHRHNQIYGIKVWG